MDEIIEIENYVDAKGMRYLHLMSNAEIDIEELDDPWMIPDGVNTKSTHEAGVFHLRATWQAKQAFAGTMRGSDRRERQMVLWVIEQGDRVSACVRDATVQFRKAFGRNPNFAALRAIPKGVVDDCFIEIGGGQSVALVECADVPKRFVMVF